MSGDSTNEWERYLFSGSSGWSILNEPLPLVSLPLTLRLPAKKPLPLASTPNTWVRLLRLLPESPCNRVPPVAVTNLPAMPAWMVHPEPLQVWLNPAIALLGELPWTPTPLELFDTPCTPKVTPVVAFAPPSTPLAPAVELFVEPTTPVVAPVVALAEPLTPAAPFAVLFVPPWTPKTIPVVAPSKPLTPAA